MSLHAAADTDVCVCTKRFRTSLLGKLPVALFFVGPTRRDVGMSDCAARSGRYMMHRHNERDKVEVPDWCATRTDGAGTLPDPVWQGSCASTLALCQSHEAMGGTASHAAQCSDEVVAVSEHPARCSAGEAALPGESNPKLIYTPQPLHRRPARYTRGLPPSAAPQPSELARDLAELSQRSASGAEGAGGRGGRPGGPPPGPGPARAAARRRGRPPRAARRRCSCSTGACWRAARRCPSAATQCASARHGGLAGRDRGGLLAFCVSISARASSKGALAHGAAACARVPAPAGVACVARPARRGSARLRWLNRPTVPGQPDVLGQFVHSDLGDSRGAMAAGGPRSRQR